MNISLYVFSSKYFCLWQHKYVYFQTHYVGEFASKGGFELLSERVEELN